MGLGSGRTLAEAFAILTGAGFSVRLGRPARSTLPPGLVASEDVNGQTVVLHPSIGPGLRGAGQSGGPGRGHGRGNRVP